MYNIFSWLSSGIIFTLTRFELIKFGNNKKGQARKPVKYENIIVDIVNILGIENNYRFL